MQMEISLSDVFVHLEGEISSGTLPQKTYAELIPAKKKL